MIFPDCASLHPGYPLLGLVARRARHFRVRDHGA